ncbi:MAG: ABC transporter permease [Bacteroidales bacterium]
MSKVFFFIKLIRESLATSIDSILSNKLRAFLSLLGITIGIFSVIVVLSFFQSIERTVRETMEGMGGSTLYIDKYPWVMKGEFAWWEYNKRPTPKYEEYEAVSKKCALAKYSAFTKNFNSQVKYKDKNYEVNIVTCTHDFINITHMGIEQGRYFTNTESERGSRVAIVGSNICKNLLGDDDQQHIGKEIMILGNKLKIIGVFEKKGNSVVNTGIDNAVMIPFNFGRKLVNIKSDYMNSSIVVTPKPGISTEQLSDDLKRIMRAERRLKPKEKDNFAINQMSLLDSVFDNIFGVLNMVSWLIGSFSLLIGGFGIATIMFISVKERTAQIGIKKALGAKSFFILTEFIFEAIFLALIGGVFGLILVYITTIIFTSLTGIKVVLSIGNILIGLLVSSAIGFISGYFPARKASRLAPVDAMRSSF